MFGYLRLFIMVSLISVVIIAGMVGMYFRATGTADLISMAERQNQLAVDSYTESVWRHSPITRLTRSSLAAEITEAQAAFTQQSKHYLQMTHATRFNIFNASGQPLYIHDGTASPSQVISKQIAAMRTSNKQLMSAVERDVKSLSSGAANSSAVLRSLIAIQNNNATQAYVETYVDISNEYNKVILLQWVASGSIILVFLILMWILIQTSKRAEEIIARQHESNMELASKAAVAEAENQQKSMFLANISHELRTPLNAIIGFSEIIKQELIGEIKNERYTNYVVDIHNAGVHLLSLINDILDFSKAEAGKLEIEVSEVNASKMVQNCIRLVSPRAESGSVIMIDAMPKEALALHTDGKKLKQILLNLLSNAVKFTPEGGEVRVSAWRNLVDNTIGFEVKDSGIGIAAKDISRAMSPFGQVDNALSRKYEGTGLGLPLTKKFVEIMGGDFKIESVEGKGTTITFTLPIQYKGKNAIVEKHAA